MEVQEFIEKFAEQFDETSAGEFRTNTEFRALEDWSSVIALSIIAMVRDEYGVTIEGDDIRESRTVGDLFNVVRGLSKPNETEKKPKVLAANNDITILIKKTTELSESELNEILVLFNIIFEKDRAIEYVHNQFFNTVLGYSYHSLLYDGNVMVGCRSYIPSYYTIDGKTYLSALCLDTMISKKYQGQGHFQDMFHVCIDYMRNDGIVFIIGFPNDNSHPVLIKTKLMRDIGDLSVYALPYRIGGIKAKLKVFNFLSVFFVNCYVFLSSLFAGNKTYHFPIVKEMESYNKIRYSQLGGNYHIEQNKDGGFVYKIMDYEGVRAVFLIDVFVKSPRNFIAAIKHIIKRHHKEFDILLYVGSLSFEITGLIKVPQRFSPKNFHFVGKLLQENAIKTDLFFNRNNWDVNLSNYDLL